MPTPDTDKVKVSHRAYQKIFFFSFSHSKAYQPFNIFISTLFTPFFCAFILERLRSNGDSDITFFALCMTIKVEMECKEGWMGKKTNIRRMKSWQQTLKLNLPIHLLETSYSML